MLTKQSTPGETWNVAVEERFRGSAVLEVAFSPRFAENRTILAATDRRGRGRRSTDPRIAAPHGRATFSRRAPTTGRRSRSLTPEPADGEEFFCLATGPHVLRPSGTVVGHWNALYPSSLETAIRSVVASLDFADDNTLFVATSRRACSGPPTADALWVLAHCRARWCSHRVGGRRPRRRRRSGAVGRHHPRRGCGESTIRRPFRRSGGAQRGGIRRSGVGLVIGAPALP